LHKTFSQKIISLERVCVKRMLFLRIKKIQNSNLTTP